MSSMLRARRTAMRASLLVITPCFVFITKTGQPNGLRMTGFDVWRFLIRS
jgi:hypothetical protein